MLRSPKNGLLLRLGKIWAFLFVMLLMGTAFAQPAAAAASPPTALQNLMDQVLAILVPVLVTIVGAVATWVGLKIKQKLHLDVSDKTMEAWSTLAQRAALRGAEWARNKSKDLVGDKKLPGGEVMEVAANWAIEMAKQQKLPDMAREKLVGLIEAELFKLRQAEHLTVLNLPGITPTPQTDLSKVPRV